MDMDKILHVIPSRFEHDFKIRSLPAAQASVAAIHFPKGASGQGALRHEFHSRPAVVRCHDHPMVATSVAFNPHVKVGKNPTPESPRGPAFPIGNRHLPRPVGQYHTCATPAGDHSKAISLDPQPAGPPNLPAFKVQCGRRRARHRSEFQPKAVRPPQPLIPNEMAHLPETDDRPLLRSGLQHHTVARCASTMVRPSAMEQVSGLCWWICSPASAAPAPIMPCQ